ncbi:MAG: TRAP transporter small permease subunit [Spirochaetaceae bacterium]|jgi:TRAP-type C4-dicarboxylate transport system permease small subunit|nr:TRAP transporter small permease subunit [Spirochaetaceae bacterium]
MRKVYRLLCKAEVIVCGTGFVGLIALVFMSAILRFFRVSMSWNIDMAMLLLAWTAFLGADIAYRSGQLVGIDLFTRNLPKKLRSILEIFLFIIILVGLGFVVFFGAKLAKDEWIRTYQSMPVPYSIVTISIVLASVSMIFSTMLKIRRRILSLAKKE